MILVAFINILLIIIIQIMELPLLLKFICITGLLIYLYYLFLKSTEDLK